MSSDFNQTILAGHLEASPQFTRRGDGGGLTATLLVVTVRRRRERAGDSGGDVRLLHTVKVFDAKATAIEQQGMRPGDQVFVEGRIDYVRTLFQGRAFFSAEIIAERVIPGSRQSTNR